MCGRANLHRLASDINVTQLFELMIHARQLTFDVLGGVRNPVFDPGNVQKDTPMGTATAFLDLAHDAARHVIAGEQLRRAAGVLISGAIPPSFLLIVSSLALVVRRD